MTNEQAVEWARRAKSTCNTSIDGDAATLLHWTDNDPVVAQAIADLRIAVRGAIDHKARQVYIQTIQSKLCPSIDMTESEFERYKAEAVKRQGPALEKLKEYDASTEDWSSGRLTYKPEQ